MAKLIKKKDCKFKNGYIVKDDKVIGLPTAVWMQLNKLELMMQQYAYLDDQGEYHKAPSLEGFKRASSKKRSYVTVKETPTIDELVSKAESFMRETDAVNTANDVNKMIDRYGALVDWCASKKFVGGLQDGPLDLVMIGNPLELTPDDIASILLTIAKKPFKLELPED